MYLKVEKLKRKSAGTTKNKLEIFVKIGILTIENFSFIGPLHFEL